MRAGGNESPFPAGPESQPSKGQKQTFFGVQNSSPQWQSSPGLQYVQLTGFPQLLVLGTPHPSIPAQVTETGSSAQGVAHEPFLQSPPDGQSPQLTI